MLIKTTLSKLRRITGTSVLALSLLLALAACGEAGSASQIGATPTLPGSSQAEVGATPTATVESLAMSAPTSEPTIVSGAADPTEAATTEPTSAPTADEAVEIQATLVEWDLELSQSEVPAGKVRIVVANSGQFNHNLTVTDSVGEIARTTNFTAVEGPQTVEVDLQPGTYTLVCSLPGHAQRGQTAELVVK